MELAELDTQPLWVSRCSSGDNLCAHGNDSFCSEVVTASSHSSSPSILAVTAGSAREARLGQISATITKSDGTPPKVALMY